MPAWSSASSAAVLDLKEFLRGYLIAYMFWTGLTLGCMALLMVQYLSGGFWGLSIRRMLEAGAKNLPLMFVLFLPMLFSAASSVRLDERSGADQGEPLVPEPAGWIVRWLVYFAIWGLLTYALVRRGDMQDAPVPAGT